MSAGQRDKVGLAHWCAFTGGVLMVAAAYGDLPHLRCLLYAGVITACGTAIALLSRWVSRGQIPGSVTSITDAPSALELAAANERRIEELELRADITDTKLVAIAGAIARRDLANGLRVPDKEDTQPILRLVPRGEASLRRLAVAGPLGRRWPDDLSRVAL